MAEEKFREAMAGAQEIGANVLATTQEIACRFFLLSGNVNRRQGAGAIEDGQLRGIAAVGFHAIARAARNQRGGDHVTRHAVRGQRALEVEATGAGLITAAHGTLSAEPVNEAQNRRGIRRQRMQRRRTLPG